MQGLSVYTNKVQYEFIIFFATKRRNFLPGLSSLPLVIFSHLITPFYFPFNEYAAIKEVMLKTIVPNGSNLHHFAQYTHPGRIKISLS